VKLAFKPAFWHTLYLWACAVLLCGLCCDVWLWASLGRWFPLAVVGSFVIYLDVKVAVMIIRHEEKKRWR
jgi:uncharacterized protein (DUF983 family)